MSNTVENDAIKFATRSLEQRGYTVKNVSRGKRSNSEHKGYDLIVHKPNQGSIKIEVKGCTRPWGIPDLYETEFDKDKRLVADFLYVIYFLNREPARLCEIPREALKPEHIVAKSGYRIRSCFEQSKDSGTVFATTLDSVFDRKSPTPSPNLPTVDPRFYGTP
jgi:hypothetical protein